MAVISTPFNGFVQISSGCHKLAIYVSSSMVLIDFTILDIVVLYQFPIVAVTNYHKLRGLKQQLLCYSSGGQKSRYQSNSRAVFIPEVLRENPFPCLFQLLEATCPLHHSNFPSIVISTPLTLTYLPRVLVRALGNTQGLPEKSRIISLSLDP